MSRQLIKDSSIYALGALLSKSLGFLLIPLYTRYLSVSEYGSLALLNLILQFVSFACLLGISTAAMRFYFDEDADTELRSQLYGNATFLLLFLPPIMLAVIGPIIWFFSDTLLSSISFMPYILIVLFVGVFTPLNKLVSGLLRVQRRAWTFIMFNLAFFLVQTITIIVAVAVLNYGLLGQLYAQLIAQVIFTVVALWILLRFGRLNADSQRTARLLKFGIPLVPFFVLGWLDTAIGRFLLERYNDLAQVGLFALASQFAAILTLTSHALDKAFMPHFFERAGAPGGDAELGLLVTRYLGFLGLLSLVIIMLAGPIILLVAAPDYHGAIPYVAPLTLAGCLYALRRPIFWCFTHTARTRELSLIQTAAGALLVAAMFLFVREFNLGVNGVVYASLLANLLFLGVGFMVSRSGFALRIPWARFVPICAVLLTSGLAIAYAGDATSFDPGRFAVQSGIFVLAAFGTLRLAGIRDARKLFRSGAP